MMVHIVLRIECREREPRKLRREHSAFHSFPKRARPFDVIVTVKITAADCRSRELKLPEEDADGDGARYKLDDANG